VDILKFQHLNSSKSSQFSKQNFNILALCLQDIFANTGFTISNVLRALILHLQIQSNCKQLFGYVGGISTLFANKSNFRQILVMMVGSPLFMQTISTSNFMHWLPRLYCLSLHHLIVTADLSLTFSLQPKLKSVLSDHYVNFRDTHRRTTACCLYSRVCTDLPVESWGPRPYPLSYSFRIRHCRFQLNIWPHHLSRIHAKCHR
jgi:hypothetical protein